MKRVRLFGIVTILILGGAIGTYLYLKKHSAIQMAKECREFQTEVIEEIKILKNTQVDRQVAANNLVTIKAKNKNLTIIKNALIETLRSTKIQDKRLLELITILDNHCQINELIATKNK